MKKIVYIAPHLSTGGMPQYLVKKIESMKEEMDVYCIEWDNVTGGVLVVQRNKMVNLLGDKLITLGEDKNKLFEILDSINPDIIHLEEIPEFFMPDSISDRLYSQNRKYLLFETSHDSGFNIYNKRYFPDKFLMVSNFQIETYKPLNVPIDLVEYPIENKVRTKTREQALLDLGLDPKLKHVINVGLFTPRKNQAEVFEYARMLQNYPIQFHFLGNQADNFRFYWEPLMKNFPSNCKWWNERSDVDKFYEAADLFLFTSRGHDTDRETMPLVIREALGWKIPSLIYNLPVYMGYFDKFDTIEYLTDNIQKNTYRIAEKLLVESVKLPSIHPTKTVEVKKPHKDCIIISSYPNTDAITQITKDSILRVKKLNIPIILASHCPIPTELQALVDYCVVDKNNILTNHTFYKVSWYTAPDFYASINLTGEGNDIYHGPAVYTNYYNALSFARSLGFEDAHCWNYDVLLNDDTQIKIFRDALQRKKAVMRKTDAQEGNALLTVRFGINIEFFLKHFPQIQTEKDYSDWMSQLSAESNGLENMWYHALKNNLNEIELLSDTDYDAVRRSGDEICSMVEYFTLLPIENNSNEGMVWYSSNNERDNRTLLLYVNGELVDTVSILGRSQYHRKFDLHTTNEIKFNLIDPTSNTVVKSRTIVVDEDYINNKIVNNGIFRYENS